MSLDEISTSDNTNDEIAKLSQQNINNITNTHQITHPNTKLTVEQNTQLYSNNTLINSCEDSVHGFEVSLLNCFGLTNVHKVTIYYFIF